MPLLKDTSKFNSILRNNFFNLKPAVRPKQVWEMAQKYSASEKNGVFRVIDKAGIKAK